MNQGTFTATAHGGKTLLKLQCRYSVEDTNIARLEIPYFEVDSNSTDLFLQGLPTFLQPATTKTHRAIGQDAGKFREAHSKIDPALPGLISYSLDGDALWSESGKKGLGFASPGLFDSSVVTKSPTTLGYELS